jgi:pimeloyl-ACP methyl ester carboxylesterase
MPLVEVNGVKTFYESKGEGKPLLMVHGAGGCYANWGIQLSELSKKLRAIAIDLPGHGKSERLKEKATIERFADHIAAFMKQIKLDKAVIAGHSMGGAIVQLLALKRPELFEKLIIVDSSAYFPDPGDSKLPGSPENIRDLIRTQPLEVVGRAIMSRLFSKKTIEKGHMGSMLKYLLPDSNFDPMIMVNDFEAGRGFDIREKIKDINIPTLILAGGDSMIPIAAAQFLHERIKGSALEIIKDSGHMIMLEKPEEFNEAILRFVAK